MLGNVPQKLITKFLFFRYSCACNSGQRKNSGTSYITLERTRFLVYCAQVSKVQFSCGLKKSPLNI